VSEQVLPIFLEAKEASTIVKENRPEQEICGSVDRGRTSEFAASRERREGRRPEDPPCPRAVTGGRGPDGPAWPDTQISEALSVHPNTVAGIRERFVEQGLAAALNRKKQDRPSRLPKLDGRAEARLLAERCGPPPQGRKRWTLQLLADRLVALHVVDEISYETVRRTLKKTS